MSHFTILNILIYIHLSIFTVSLLVIVNVFFIYINDYQFIQLDDCIGFSIYTSNFFYVKKKHVETACIPAIFLKKIKTCSKARVKWLIHILKQNSVFLQKWQNYIFCIFYCSHGKIEFFKKKSFFIYIFCSLHLEFLSFYT